VYCPVTLWGIPEVNDAVAINVSKGGMALSLAEKLQVGTLLRLSALIPNAEPVDATAEVVWEHGYKYEQRVGVRFLSPSERALSALARLTGAAGAATGTDESNSSEESRSHM
jgi:hypothetical protein